MRRSTWFFGISVAVVMAGATYALATDFSVPLRVKRFLTETPSWDPAAWPNDAAKLTPPQVSAPQVSAPAGFGRYRVFVDPGHGAKNNTGNRSSYCEDEQDFTLALAEELGAFLEESGTFEVQLSRPRNKLVPYPERVNRANAWKAHVFVSLHSDIRGRSVEWSPTPGKQCLRNDDAPGFSVLWSDEGALAERRRDLARATATAMLDTGFPAYDGAEYHDYDGDPTSPGVFLDRHALGKRIFVLRKPKMPSIVVETHNALDTREARRWAEKDTRAAFHATVHAALIAFLGDGAK